MKDEFLTFTEFAKLVKIDRSTLYRRVANTVALQQLVQQLATGQKVINRSAMRFFTVADTVATCNNDPQQKIIDFLMAEIEDLKKDKENLTLANADLRKLLDQQQQLNLHNQELLALEKQKLPRIKGGWKH